MDIESKFQFHTGYDLVVGVELEFYLDEEEFEKTNLFDDVKFFDSLSKESSEFQYEIRLGPTADISGLIKSIKLVKDKINNHCIKRSINYNFEAKPFEDKSGSSFHVNLSVSDFSANYNYIIAGLISILPNVINIYLPGESSLKRIACDMNTPSVVSWGPDNRTVMVRVINSSIIPNRVEFRLCGADVDYEKVIDVLAYSCAYGIKNKLKNNNPKIYGNAFDKQYNLINILDVKKHSNYIKYDWNEL